MNINNIKLSLDLIKEILYYNFMDMFSALADPTRRNILEMLAHSRQLSATDISDNFHISAPAVSQHLKILRETKLVTVEKKAQQRLYQINPASIDEFQIWIDKMKKTWDERFNRLDKILKEEKSHYVLQRRTTRDKKKGRRLRVSSLRS